MTDIKSEVERYAELAVSEAQILNAAITGDWLNEPRATVAEDYGLTNGWDWLDLLDNMALEIYGNARVTHNSSDIRTITVVTGIGGPHVEFTVDYNDNVIGKCYWGNDRAEKYDTLPGLFDALLPLVGEE